jgi:hypothetical protein
MFRKLIPVSLLTLSAFAQSVPVHITSTPEAIGTLYAVTHSKKIGKHNVLLCNDGQAPVDMPRERVLQALKDLPVIDVTEANILMRDAYGKNWKFSVARYAEYALILTGVAASGGTGAIVSISTRGMSKLVGGIGIAHVLGDRLKGEVPSLDPFLANALNDTVHLGPAGSANQCASRIVFTGVIHGVHGYDLTVQVPTSSVKTASINERDLVALLSTAGF